MKIFIVVTVGWLFSLCLHEFSHALVAFYGGDTSVRDKGYLTFNPFKYTHPMYSIIMPLVFLAMGGLGLPGGAVYIEHWRLRNRWWDSAVSLAGPASNVGLTLLLAVVLWFRPAQPTDLWAALSFLALIQVSAIVLNMLPIPPLDGYGWIAPHLDPATRRQADAMGRYSLWIVFLMLWYVEAVAVRFWMLVDLICGALGIPVELAREGWRGYRFWVER